MTTTSHLVESFPSYIPTAEDPWLPWDATSRSEIKLAKLNPSTGEMTVFIKTPPGQTLTKHFHPGTVHVYVIQGQWSYGEGWVAKAGDVVIESAGSTHAPTMYGDEPVIIFAVIQGSLNYVDDDGDALGYDNWQTLLKLYLDYCHEHDITPREDLTRW